MKRCVQLAIGVTLITLPLAAFGQTATNQGNAAPANSQPANTLNLPTGRIAVINTGAFAAQGGIGQLRQQIDRVNEIFKERQAEIQALRQRGEALQNEIQMQRANLTPQSLAAKQSELEELQVDLKRKGEDFKRDYNKAIRDATNPVLERVEAFLSDFVKKHDIMLVLEAAVLTQARGLSYVDPGLDITKPFIDAYNAANPVSTASSKRSGTTNR